jgi:hypothetical protein
MSSEIIQSVTYANCNDFQQHIFTKRLFHYFQDYLNDETDPRERY